MPMRPAGNVPGNRQATRSQISPKGAGEELLAAPPRLCSFRFAALLGARCPDCTFDVLTFLGRWEDGFHPKGFHPELPAPALRVIKVLVFLVFHFLVCL